jgi:hypothetical protein
MIPQTRRNYKIDMVSVGTTKIFNLNLENGFFQFSDAHKIGKELSNRFFT